MTKTLEEQVVEWVNEFYKYGNEEIGHKQYHWIKQALLTAEKRGEESARREFEPDVKLAKFLRKEGQGTMALWIETKNDKYLEKALGLPEGSFEKFTNITKES